MSPSPHAPARPAAPPVISSPAGHPPGHTGNPARDLVASPNVRIFLFLLAHVPLAALASASPWAATAHAALAVLYGLRAALLKRPHQVAYAVTYIAASEVLWRMAQAHLLWEFAKYAIVLIIFVALVVEWGRDAGERRLRTVWPMLLLLALMPGAVLTILEVGLGEARDPLSFNLSGHLALIMLALYLWARSMDRDVTVRVLLALMAPILTITFVAVYTTLTELNLLAFQGESNWITSGGYGPNQVSNMLGLGALAGVILFTLMPRRGGPRLTIMVITLLMLGQALLTFSRGGVYSFGVGLAFFGFHLMRSRGGRRRFLVLFVLFAALLSAIVFPSLDNFTGGTLAERFQDTDTTGRLEAAQADMRAFLDNPLVGVGVGQAVDYHREVLGMSVAAHTELTRLLAEHGLFGLLAIAIMAVMLISRYLGNRPGLSRATTAALAVWSMSITLHTAMRIVAVPLAFGLALVAWRLDAGADQPEDTSVGVEPHVYPPEATRARVDRPIHPTPVNKEANRR